VAAQPGESRIVFLRPPVTSAGFALPIDDMKPVLAALRQGKMVHCWLGVDMGEERKTEEVDGTVTSRRTVFVTKVYPGSPAAAAGLMPGDVLATVNGRPVTRLFVMRAALLRAQPGEGMELRIDRKGAISTITARLAAHPETQPDPRAH
jgi:S1-C subfamily serine protease